MRLRQLSKLVERLATGDTYDWAASYQLSQGEPDELAPGQAVQDWGLTGIWNLPEDKACLVIIEMTNNRANGWALAALQIDESTVQTMAAINAVQGTMNQSFIVPPGSRLRCEGAYVTGDPDGGGVTSVQVVPFL